MVNALILAYVAGFVVMVGYGMRYPRWRWPLLVIGLAYLVVPLGVVFAVQFLLSRMTFQFG
jgi:hypothetical protein